MANKTTVTAEPGKQELFIIREFDAPRELVFKAYTDPDLYVKWVGPNDLTMTIDKWDCRDGGSYKFTHERDGHKYAFFGVNHEVLAPERLIGTFEFDGLPERGHVILGTTKFEDLGGGRSRIVHQSVFQSVQDRDGMVQSGMERGVTEGYDKLDVLLESMNSNRMQRNMRAKAESVDAYIADFPVEVQKLLEQIRSAIKKAAPKAEETISYAIPSYKLNGMLVHFAGYANHIGFYPGAGAIKEFADDLAAYRTSKGTVQFPLGEKLPQKLITTIVKFRVKQNLEKKK